MPSFVRVVWALLLAGSGVACGADAPAPVLVVGDAGYSAGELGALSGPQREELGLLTAFGLAVAHKRLGEVGEPFIARERQKLLLQKLSIEVSVREAGKDEAALRDAYADEPEYELLVRHMVFLSERWRPDAHRQDARGRAEAALDRVRAGEDFAVLVGRLSEEPGAAERGGLLRPGREGSWVPEFWEAASSLKPGEVSGVVETEYGFHVLRLEERRVIPFEEVRYEVLGRLVDLPAAAGRARAWADEQTESLRLDHRAVDAWRVGSASDSIVLARWPGGVYRGTAFRTYRLTLDRDARTRLAAATPPAYAEVVAASAGNALLVNRAREMEIRLSPAETAAAWSRWRQQAQQWSAALGFQAGQSVRAVKAAALEALGADRQSVHMAREQVLNLAAALRIVYQVSMGPALGAE